MHPTTLSDHAERQRFTALMDGHKAKLNEAITLACGDDHFSRQCRRNAEGLLRKVNLACVGPMAHIHIGMWGENGCAPLVEDHLKSARFAARLVAERQVVAA